MSTEELISEIRKLVEEQDALRVRYRWHDLRKDPGDLPSKFGTYLIAVDENKYGRFYYTDMYDDSDKRFVMQERWNIVAWKEIEKFTEGDA